MSDARVSLYEGLFLMGPQAGSDLQGALDHIQEILDRAEADTVVLKKWEERKLAYAIRGQKRGVYIIAFFRVAHTKLPNIDRDCNLSEQVVRAMVIRADHIGETELNLAKEEEANTKVEAKLKADAAAAATEAKPAEAAATEAVATEAAPVEATTVATEEAPSEPAAEAPADDAPKSE
jgi:small subunit ribosomal protein S6